MRTAIQLATFLKVCFNDNVIQQICFANKPNLCCFNLDTLKMKLLPLYFVRCKENWEAAAIVLKLSLLVKQRPIFFQSVLFVHLPHDIYLESFPEGGKKAKHALSICLLQHKSTS